MKLIINSVTRLIETIYIQLATCSGFNVLQLQVHNSHNFVNYCYGCNFFNKNLNIFLKFCCPLLK